MVCARTHLSCRQGSKVDVRPLLFHSFTVSSPNTPHIIERIIRLARFTMTGEMEFRDVVGEFKILNVEIRVVLGETFEMIDRPLAGNIIGNGDVLNSDIFQDRGENVICIDVATSSLVDD